jgi:hypothetical protein
MQRTIIVIAALALSACAAPGYEQYLAAQQGIATARSNADIARYDALANIAQKGDSAASVAAAMALAMGGNTPQPVIAAPQNEWLQWASVLVPALTNAYAIGKSADVAIHASDNAYKTSASTTGGFVALGQQIQAPVIAAPVTPQANITNTYTLSGTGVLGSGTYQTDQHNTRPPRAPPHPSPPCPWSRCLWPCLAWPGGRMYSFS